jgi:hypothetical protein
MFSELNRSIIPPASSFLYSFAVILARSQATTRCQNGVASPFPRALSSPTMRRFSRGALCPRNSRGPEDQPPPTIAHCGLVQCTKEPARFEYASFKRAVVTLIFVAGIVLHCSGQRSTPQAHFSFDSGSFYADGRESEKGEFPSETQIDCDRRGKTCIAATAEYYSGHPHVSLEYFQVVKWDTDGLIATSDAICMQRTIIASFPNKTISISGTLRSLPREKTEACEALGASKPYRDLFVLKNSQEWNKNPYGESSGK